MAAVVATGAAGAATANGKVAIDAAFVVKAVPDAVSVFGGEAEGRIEGGAADAGGAADGSIVSTAVSAGLADGVGPDADAGGTVSIVVGAVLVVSAFAEILSVSVPVGGTGGGTGGAIDGGGGGGGALTGREWVGAEAPPVVSDDAWKSISISISIWGAGGGGNAIGGNGRP